MKVGILGGGQLGRMLALAGYPLGLTFRILDPARDACAGQVVPDHVLAGFDEEKALRRFAEGLDVITYEWENVPVEAVRYLQRFVRVDPPLGALEVSQDRLREKELFRKLGIETARWAAVDSLEGLREAVATIGVPSILKTRRLGYDGKGQYRLQSESEIEAAWQAVGAAPAILEGFVPFTRELSILAVRGRQARVSRAVTGRVALPEGHRTAARVTDQGREGWPPAHGGGRRRQPVAGGPGLFEFYPLVHNVHRDGILRISRAPTPDLPPELQAEAEDLAWQVVEATNYVGVIAIELFDVGGRLLANEMAPRVHNSGHWTIEGAQTSQFENHLRAVCGLPLGSAAALGHSAMVNLIGIIPDAGDVMRVPGAHLHLYGKEPRPGRKVGHITLKAEGPAAIETSLSVIGRVIENERE